MQDRSAFESEWERAFDNAEAEVSPAVWERLEAGIADASSGKFRKGLLMFKLLAAASVAFALSIGGAGVYQLYLKDDNSGAPQIAEADHQNRGSQEEMNPAHMAVEGNEQDIEEQRMAHENGLEKENNESSAVIPPAANESSRSQSRTALFADKSATGKSATDKDELRKENSMTKDAADGVQDKAKLAAARDGSEAMKVPEYVEKLTALLQVDPASLIEPEMVPWYSYIPASKQEQNRDLWAGVAFGAGAFDPNASSVSGAMAEQLSFDGVNADRSPAFTEETGGQAYNMGINLGKRISRKWLLQTGLMYTQQKTTNTSNAIATNTRTPSAKAVGNYAEINTSDRVVLTAPYDVENTYELISVPLQAGYILIDRPVNVIILTGVANNILLKNQIIDESGNFEEVTVDAGDDSRYKTYLLSVLVGSEISYDISSHYQLAVAPQVRQALSSATKESAGYSSYPRAFEIGFRFRYVF